MRKKIMSAEKRQAREEVEFDEIKRARVASQGLIRMVRREREAEKIARLQADLDAMRPKTEWLKHYSEQFRSNVIRGKRWCISGALTS